MRMSILNTATTEQMGCGIVCFFFRLYEIYKFVFLFLKNAIAHNIIAMLCSNPAKIFIPFTAFTPPEITRIQEVPASISPTRIFCPLGGSSSAERPSTDNVEATDAMGSASVQKLNVIVHKNKIVINLLHGKVPII